MKIRSETIREMRRLSVFIRPHWKLIPLIFVFVIFYSAGIAVRALVLEPVTKHVLVDKPDLPIMTTIFWVVSVTAVVLGFSSFFREYFRRYLLFRMLADLRQRLASHLLTLSMGFYNNQRVGELMSKLTNDIEYTRNGLRFMTGDIFQRPVTLIVLVGAGFYVSWQLSLFTFLILPMLFISIAVFGRQVRRSSRKGLGKLADVTETMQQFITGIKIVKGFNRETHEQERFREVNESHFRRMLRVAWAKSLSVSFNEFFYNAGAALLILVCGILVAEYRIVEMPKVIAFMAVVFSMYQPIKSLSKAYNMIQESVAGSSRIFELMDLRPDFTDADDAIELTDVAESVAFKNVTFSYGDEPVLRDVSVTAQRGQVTALVGESGAGKSTFVDLLMRFYDIDDGAIEIDGTDIRTVTLSSLLSNMAIVTQDPFLFNATIRDNIRYGRLDATEEEIQDAARAAFIHDIIESEVEGGYDAVVGERGVKLSGGQRQRITIARAIVRNPRILLLDEATASLDSESEKHVQLALNNLMEGRTTFVVAHRLSTILHADTILVFDNGRIVEQGRHEELLKLNRVYARLYNQQYADQERKDPETA